MMHRAALLLACYAALGTPGAAFTQGVVRCVQPRGGSIGGSTATRCPRRCGVIVEPTLRARRALAHSATTESSDLYTEEASEDAVSVRGESQDWAAEAPAPRAPDLVLQRKLELLSAVAGLDRGAAAGAVQRKAVVAAAEALERESTIGTFPAALAEADGLWRLVYSSALSAGSGSGGGASAASSRVFQTPDTGSFSSFGPGSQVGQVYARISSRKQRLENIVEVFLRAPLPFLPQLGKVVLNLEHKMEVICMPRACVCLATRVRARM
jgi:hypothetical protein